MYERIKLKNGIVRSCEKRPISMAQIDKIVDNVEKALYNSLEAEIPSSKIGDLVMEQLKQVDEIAYVRFAVVYRQFKDVEILFSELNKLFKKDSSN